jgi:uncharacterized membrane protein
MSRVCLVCLVALMGLVGLVRLVRSMALVRRVCLVGGMLRVRGMALVGCMCLVGRQRLLVLLLLLMLLVVMREYRIVLDGLAHRVREEHRGRVGLLHLPRGSGALARNAEGIGNVGVGRPSRAIGNLPVERARRGEEVLRVCCLGRLVRCVGLGLVRRGGVRSRRLFVRLAGVGRREGDVAAEAGLGEVEARMAVGAGRAQS